MRLGRRGSRARPARLTPTRWDVAEQISTLPDARTPSSDTIRYVGLGLVVTAWTVLWAWLQWSPSGISWHFFADSGHALIHTSGLHIYAQNRNFQFGPVTFVASAMLTILPAHTARVVAQVLMMIVGPLLVLWLAPLVPLKGRTLRVFLAALVVIPGWAVLSVRWGHLDDVLAMLFTVAAIRAVAARKPIWAGLAIAAAVASKPWAIGFVPLLLVLERRRIAAFGTAALAVLAVYAPFFIADTQTIRAFRPIIKVSPDAGLHALGYRGVYVPSWGRTAQLVAAPLIALVAVLKSRWPGLFIAAFAVRLVLDPQDLPYYVGAAAVAAVIFDLLATRWAFPWLTLVTVLVLWQPFVANFAIVLQTAHGWSLWWYAHPTTVSFIHVGWAVATVVFVLFAPGRWLGTPNRALPQFRWPTSRDATSSEPVQVRTETM